MIRPLTLGRHVAPFPLVQGGMGVRISAGSLAGHVARCGGVGLVATAGLGMNSPHFTGRNLEAADLRAVADEIQKAKRIAAGGVVGINAMVAVSDYDEVVRVACSAGAQVVVSGAGLPMSLPELTADWPEVALVPIVSSVKAAELIARRWHKRHARLPDAVVVEDPDTAGGHLGADLNSIGTGVYDQIATVRGVKAYFLEAFGVDVPVISAGGIWSRADLEAALAQGADGVQMATRFVCTEECDAPLAYKEAYLAARREDIGLIMSPAGLPGRALIGNLERVRSHDIDGQVRCSFACLKKCTYKENRDRFCIIGALDRAQQGDVDTGLVFCGTNAWRADHIGTVQEVFDDLFPAACGELRESAAA